MGLAIRYILKFFDWICGAYFGITIIEVMGIFLAGGSWDDLLNSADGYFKIPILVIATAYAAIRLRHFYLNTELDRLHKKEDLKKKRFENLELEKKSK